MGSLAPARVTLEEALTNILKSVDLEESALASFIEIEKEKLYTFLNGMDNEEDMKQLEKNITFIIQIVTEMKKLLQMKREKLLNVQGKSLRAVNSRQQYTYSLLGNGKGIITKKGDFLCNGSVNFQIHLQSYNCEDNYLNYQVQKSNNRLTFFADPGTFSVRCPSMFQAKPSPESPNILILTGRGELTANSLGQTNMASFTLTVWDGGSGPPGTDKLQITIKADNNQELDHDSGIVYLSGNLTINSQQYRHCIQTSVLYGAVKSGEQPIPQAVVRLLDNQGNNFKQTLTETDGRYEITNLPPGKYAVTTWAEGYFSSSVWKIDLIESHHLELNINIEKNLNLKGNIMGQIEDALTKEFIANCPINLYSINADHSESFLRTAFSDQQGRFVLKVREGKYRLEVDYLEERKHNILLELRGNEKSINSYLKIFRNSNSLLKGRVQDNKGNPIAGVEVILYKITEGLGKQEILIAISTTRTDLDGGYLFSNLPTANNYKVIANI
mgnify:CR=1 FL=1